MPHYLSFQTNERNSMFKSQHHPIYEVWYKRCKNAETLKRRSTILVSCFVAMHVVNTY